MPAPRRRPRRARSATAEFLIQSTQDRIFVSNIADNGIQEIDAETGAARLVISGKPALPGGIGVVSDGGKDTLYVADVFAIAPSTAPPGRSRSLPACMPMA